MDVQTLRRKMRDQRRSPLMQQCRQASDLRAIETIWYSRQEHQRSLVRLAGSGHRFEYVFPGHGDWTKGPVNDMSDRLVRLT